jgi:ABC-type multidrug transport system ATPase subunit
LDEPTAGLDPGGSDEVLRLIRSLTDGEGKA